MSIPGVNVMLNKFVKNIVFFISSAAVIQEVIYQSKTRVAISGFVTTVFTSLNFFVQNG